jgi:hypothetical protein
VLAAGRSTCCLVNRLTRATDCARVHVWFLCPAGGLTSLTLVPSLPRSREDLAVLAEVASLSLLRRSFPNPRVSWYSSSQYGPVLQPLRSEFCACRACWVCVGPHWYVLAPFVNVSCGSDRMSTSALIHPSMWGYVLDPPISTLRPNRYSFNVTDKTFPYDNRPVTPLMNLPFEKWWWVSIIFNCSCCGTYTDAELCSTTSLATRRTTATSSNSLPAALPLRNSLVTKALRTTMRPLRGQLLALASAISISDLNHAAATSGKGTGLALASRCCPYCSRAYE